jgi:hypothetical protein
LPWFCFILGSDIGRSGIGLDTFGYRTGLISGRQETWQIAEAR